MLPVADASPMERSKVFDILVGLLLTIVTAITGERVRSMELDEVADFEARTFRQWDRASLSALCIAIGRRRRDLGA